ncbi:Gfo/Idh/MocA family protein [Bacillus songklensis]|uniref:Gfo/Idh/MocA family protein n=1 Tax=Bacillus songklensis TaxID=1069116 RepID=A0ABV8B6C9_9BACI
MEKVRWGILSTANIAQTMVIPAIHRSKNAEVIGIASRSIKAKEVASQLNIPKSYDTYEALLQDPDIDAVYIPLPNHLHKKWVIEAANHGKHVLCEKPAALNAEETIEMIKVCREKNVKFMEAFMYQFHPQHKRVREIIASGEIGEVKLMRSSFSFYLDQREENIRMNKEMGGGSIYDIGCYCIHAIRNVLGSEPSKIEVYGEIDPLYGVDMSAIAYLKLKNGVNAIFDCSFDMVLRQQYEIVGTEGQIFVPRSFRPDLNGGEGVIIVQRETEERTEKIPGDIYVLEVEHFSEIILEDGQPFYSAENVIQNMRVIDACYQSIKNNVVNLANSN